jgi:hypothetical protein
MMHLFVSFLFLLLRTQLRDSPLLYLIFQGYIVSFFRKERRERERERRERLEGTEGGKKEPYDPVS